MNNIALGQYVDKDSVIHRLDPRTKIIALVIMMIGVFLIPSPFALENYIYSFIALGIVAVLILIVILLTKVSLGKYLSSLKQILFLLCFTLFFQLFQTIGDGTTIVDTTLHFSVLNICIVIGIFVLFILLRKFLKAKLLIFICLLALSIYIFSLNIGTPFTNTDFKLYKFGLLTGLFFVSRVLLVIVLSTVLTLTTKPTDLTAALEWLLHPLTFFKIPVSIFAMMMSLALRFIPTLFNEMQKILKAQSSRGVDFKEGNLKSQIMQIISLLIPMFVISIKRAEDLADAMEARGYIPGAPRTKIDVMKFRFVDYIYMFISFALIITVIVWKVMI